ncbi:MAG: hypothetical protein COZ46_03400 [Verrucomicrobia bacterium CG_4_10_14_3_um_filter_43_23]|nr:MAG: hypothetical protein AUJ82_05610 [Verrucomicrobia bacterium CG1_02_43_26]PIP58799.1 MAG: hypothetical protein COX01_07250 [Verrucomicrobia bacterium CG22_combo_CG10-13_8_21_14_all_43_17]PIX58540.1 MAG: hypothetical protein COZ46_03400 [Verrucomicrobia bacterium CG_4_10_14_3_um_filter_43_23]PIY61490.1 MAG: hypothetical protein COY94_04760 [Verrucomicrobia bacterium CG_4_10_14_0_8_um_filter_43_34]PJA44804.1 MAG: hypothetical protein CO175_01105 [Verrucomicrobia bacterium CG_4_9_14_3_um_fi
MSQGKKYAFSQKETELISELRGIPYPSRKLNLSTLFSIDSLLERNFKKYNIGRKTSEMVIMENWKAIVGSQRAHRCCPSKIIEGGVLIITINNPILRNELYFERRQILNKIHALPGCESIKDILLDLG